MTGFRESKRSTRTGRRDQRHFLAHLAGGVVEHLLPCGVQPVLVSHDALLSHKHHLPGSIVHAHSPLISQCCLLCLLLGLGGGVGKDHQETELQKTPGCPWRPSLGKDKRRKKAHCNAGFTSQTALRISAEEAKFYKEYVPRVSKRRNICRNRRILPVEGKAYKIQHSPRLLVFCPKKNKEKSTSFSWKVVS